MFTAQRRAVAAALLTACLLAPAATGCAPGDGVPAAARARDTAATPAGQERYTLPRPTGPHPTGRDTLHLVDPSRRDPWVPSAGAREVLVSLLYPAGRGHGADGERAAYLSPREAELLVEGQKLTKLVTARQVAAFRTNARTGARPAPGRHPLVVLSPGFTLHRATLSVLAEELASHGYVVALLDHAHESFGTDFPRRSGSGTRTLTCAACDRVEQAPDDAGEKKVLARAARNRAADISFVVDELTGGTPHATGPRPRDYAPLIDTRRIGAAGHSLGGNAAAVAAGTDRRIRAAADLDGTFFAPVPRAGTGRPLLLLGTEDGHTPRAEDTTWLRQWHRQRGWKRWLTVTGTGHLSFTDLPVLGARLGVTDPTAPLSGERSRRITTGYVTAFFDHHLRTLPRPLLDAPTPTNPEVTFHRP
ncbi:alpha/beta hydrolase family protein [Streptomyces albus]|uniref:alpha/beta hydrolase family protein n=1 Tax=Streptomyces albus TaxID=1888 RepID=UPI0037B8696A